MIKIFRKDAANKTLFFNNLYYGDTYTIFGHSVIYMKIVDLDEEEYQLELETGRMYPPTPSRVVKVSVELHEV